MNAIIPLQPQFMSSKEIAELTRKRHADVIRDIRQMLDKLDDAILRHEEYQELKDDRGYTSEFLLNKNLTLTLMTGYDVNTRHKINVRWQELETAQATPIAQKKSSSFNLGSVTRQCVMMAKAFGLKGNQVFLSADRAVKQITGESPLELLGATHLHAPVQEQVFTPTQIGEMLEPKLSGQKVNKLLIELGYQTKEGDVYLLTKKGQGLGELFDTGKKHSDGVPVKQLKWHQSVVQLIKGEVA